MFVGVVDERNSGVGLGARRVEDSDDAVPVRGGGGWMEVIRGTE